MNNKKGHMKELKKLLIFLSALLFLQTVHAQNINKEQKHDSVWIVLVDTFKIKVPKEEQRLYEAMDALDKKLLYLKKRNEKMQEKVKSKKND